MAVPPAQQGWSIFPSMPPRYDIISQCSLIPSGTFYRTEVLGRQFITTRSLLEAFIGHLAMIFISCWLLSRQKVCLVPPYHCRVFHILEQMFCSLIHLIVETLERSIASQGHPSWRTGICLIHSGNFGINKQCILPCVKFFPILWADIWFNQLAIRNLHSLTKSKLVWARVEQPFNCMNCL